MHQTVLGEFFFGFFNDRFSMFEIKKVHIKNFKSLIRVPTKDSWATSYLSKVPQLCQCKRINRCKSFLFEHEKGHFFLLWASFVFLLHFLGECPGEKTWLCKTNEKYDVCSSEGFIRRIRLQSQLLI